MAETPTPTLIVGISGPSSSGKTTLARLLQRIFCGVNLDNKQQLNTFIIHEDDFYYPDDQCVPFHSLPYPLLQPFFRNLK